MTLKENKTKQKNKKSGCFFLDCTHFHSRRMHKNCHRWARFPHAALYTSQKQKCSHFSKKKTPKAPQTVYFTVLPALPRKCLRQSTTEGQEGTFGQGQSSVVRGEGWLRSPARPNATALGWQRSQSQDPPIRPCFFRQKAFRKFWVLGRFFFKCVRQGC